MLSMLMTRFVRIGLIVLGLVFSLTVNSNAQGSITTTVCPGVGCQVYPVNGAGTARLQITGTFVGTLAFESTVNNSTYDSLVGVKSGDTTYAPVVNTTTTGTYIFTAAGISSIRVKFSAWSSGTALLSFRTVTAAATLHGATTAGSIDGAITATQIAFGTGVDTIGGSANLTYAGGLVTSTSGNGLSFQGSAAPITVTGGDDGGGDTSIIFDNATDDYIVLIYNQFVDSLATAGWEVYNTNGGFSFSDLGNFQFNGPQANFDSSVFAAKTTTDLTTADTGPYFFNGTATPAADATKNYRQLWSNLSSGGGNDIFYEASLVSVITHSGAGDITQEANAVYGEIIHNGSANIARAVSIIGNVKNNSSGNIAISTAIYGKTQQLGVGTTGEAVVFWANAEKSAGTITNLYDFYGTDAFGLATNGYFLWYDGGPGSDCNKAGVYRVNDFGISAYYNPCVTKYTPGLANFERILNRWGDTGVFGTDNIAYIGLENGGTGTLRTLTLLGNIVTFETTPGTKAPVTALTFQPTSGYKSVDGTSGATVTACTGFKNGLCISGT